MTFDHRLSLTGVFCHFSYRESSSQLQLGLDLLAPFLDQGECKSTIHWLCDYITYQANKKAIHHSRDLHSMIVAAFSCLQSWIMSHPWLLDSQVIRLTDVMTDLTIIRLSVIAWVSLSVCLFAVSVEQAGSQLVSLLISQSVIFSVNLSLHQCVSLSVGQSIFQSISGSVCLSVSQSFSQSVCQSVSHSFSQSVCQCVRQSVNLFSQSVCRSVSQPVNLADGQCLSHFISQSVRQSVCHFVSSLVSQSLRQLSFCQSVTRLIDVVFSIL